MQFIHNNTLSVLVDSVWSEVITTKEFGTKTKAEALGRIVSYSARYGEADVSN